MDQGAVMILMANVVLLAIVIIFCISNERYWKKVKKKKEESIEAICKYADNEYEKFSLKLDNEDFSKLIKKVNVLKLLGDRKVY